MIIVEWDVLFDSREKLMLSCELMSYDIELSFLIKPEEKFSLPELARFITDNLLALRGIDVSKQGLDVLKSFFDDKHPVLSIRTVREMLQSYIEKIT